MFGLKRLDYRETFLRGAFILLLISLILGISMDKILVVLKIKDGETLVSLKIDKTPFSVWPSFMCGKNLSRMTAQAIKRGNSGIKDQQTDLPSDYIVQRTTGDITSGDWTNSSNVWPCFVFNANGELLFKTGDIDQITLSVWSDQAPDPAPNGLLFGIFDKERNLSSVDPFVSPTPSTNTYTFTRYQKINITNDTDSYFYVNKQNTFPMVDGPSNLVARFTYSPDSYLVVTYIEKRKYTPYDLISAVGGLITYSIAAWVIMFGRGRYRSWGLVQRYLLRNSPNAKKNNDFHKKLGDIESQINNNTLIGTPAMTNFSSSLGSDEKSRSSAFYFTNSGTPTRTTFSFSPNKVIASPSSSLQSKDLIKSIDALINQKLWSVEQTLSRHYLSGFRLRKYDIDLDKLGLDDEALNPPTVHHKWNKMDSDIQNSPPLPPPKPFSYYSSEYYQKNNSSRNSLNTLNPEEQRSQYPNVSINPFEKKYREENNESGNYQYLSTNKMGNNTTSTGIAAGKYDGNYFSNITPLSFSNPIPSSQMSVSSNNSEIQGLQQQNDNSNSDSTLSSPLQMSVSNNGQEIQQSPED